MKNKILKPHFTWIVFAFLFVFSTSVNGAEILSAASEEINKIKETEEEFRNAASRGDIRKMKQLLNSGVNIDATDQFGYTALMKASGKGRIKAVDFLIKNGANVCAINQWGRTARYRALYRDRYRDHRYRPHTKVVELLDKQSLNCKTINEQELRNAAGKGDIEKMELLLMNSVNIDATDQFGNTALMYALTQIEAMDFLIKNGANMCAINQWGKTAQDEAVAHGYTESAKLLKRTPLNCKEINEQELRNAAKKGDIEKMRQFLNSGVNIDAPDRWGYTALMEASLGNQIHAVNFLIANGANVCAKHQWGKTAQDIARDRDHTKVVELL